MNIQWQRIRKPKKCKILALRSCDDICQMFLDNKRTLGGGDVNIGSIETFFLFRNCNEKKSGRHGNK